MPISGRFCTLINIFKHSFQQNSVIDAWVCIKSKLSDIHKSYSSASKWAAKISAILFAFLLDVGDMLGCCRGPRRGMLRALRSCNTTAKVRTAVWVQQEAQQTDHQTWNVSSCTCSAWQLHWWLRTEKLHYCQQMFYYVQAGCWQRLSLGTGHTIHMTTSEC